jgi:hypothetical protein
MPADKFAFVMRRLNLTQDETLVLESPYSEGHGRDSLPGWERYRVTDLHEYVDIVYSCRAYVGAESGGQVLASAIKGGDRFRQVYAVVTPLCFNHATYTLPNVAYTVVSGVQRSDFHFVPGGE